MNSDAIRPITIITAAATNTTTKPGVERLDDQVREERLAGQHLGVDPRLLQRMNGLEQLGDRVVTEERGEQASDRRQVRHLLGDVAETPCSCRPLLSAPGSVLASPTIISEKKIPIDSDEPALKNVARTPEAAPRSAAGTLDMMAAVLGAVKMPPPRPLRKTSTANIQ